MNDDTLQTPPSLIVVQCTYAPYTAILQKCLQQLYPETKLITTTNDTDSVSMVDEHTADLVILCSELPQPHLWELVQSIRQFHEMPIVIVAPYSNRISAALKSGGDLLVRLPCTPEEIQDSIESLWRRIGTHIEENSSLQSDELFLDPQNGDVFLEGRYIKLNQKQFGILYTLMRKRGTFISPSDLYREVWGDGEDNLNSLRVRIFEIQKKLGGGWIESGSRRQSKWKPKLLQFRFFLLLSDP